jgi:aspartate kinase
VVTLKFGGTSVADTGALRRLCRIVAAEPRPCTVVVSALSGVTDQLLALADIAETGRLDATLQSLEQIRQRHATMANALCGGDRLEALQAGLQSTWTDLDALVRAVVLLHSAPPAFRDAIVACGELASSRLVAAALADVGVPAQWVDARLVLATDGRHGRAVPQHAATAERVCATLQPLVARRIVPVVGGFVGSTVDGVTTTIGRGGSDYSASIIGACLGADEIQIWTDTNGVLTADPRLLGRATTVETLSFREASALAHFGAKVLHPATVAPAIERGIPVSIRNSRNPEARCTMVTTRAAARQRPLAGLACVTDVVAFDVALPPDANRERVLADVFGTCATHGVTVYLSSVGDAEVSMTVAAGLPAERIAAALRDHGTVHRQDDLALLVAAGDGVADGRVRAGDILTALCDVHVHAVSESARGGYVAMAISRGALLSAVAALHAQFFEPPVPVEAPGRCPAPAALRVAASGRRHAAGEARL